jgi:thiol-disulfide isomerase/thioredoxin
MGTSHPAVGKKLETLDFDPLTGSAQPISAADLEGKVVVINFWGTWCKPCRVEFPHIMALEERFGSRPDFKLLAVSCNAGAPNEVTLEELRESTVDFLASRDSSLPTYADLDASVRFGIDRITPFGVFPTTIVLDGQHTIRGLWEGYREGAEREVEALVEELLRN